MKKIIVKDSSWKIIKELDQNINKTLIKQLTDEWVEVMSACHHWICWACIYWIEQWVENINKSFKGEPWFPLWDEEVMTCIAWVNWKNNDIVLVSNT